MAARVHDAVGDTAHQILAEANLRVHRAGRGEDIAGHHVAQMRRHGGRADIDGDTGHAFLQARPDADHLMAVAKGNRYLPVAGTKHRLKLLQDMKITGNLAADTVWPLRFQSLGKAAEIAGRLVHVGFAHLDEAEPDDRVHVDLPVVGRLADKLVVNLAFRRDIDDDIGLQRRLAGQAPPLGKPLFLGIAGFDGGHAAQAVRPGGDAVLGEFAGSDINLAAAAQRTATTDGIDIDAKGPCRLQHSCTGRDMALPSGWRKDDLDVVSGFRHGVLAFRQALRRRRVWRRSRPPSPAAAGSRNFWIQRRHSGSCPFITFAPMIPVISSA